MRNELTYKEKKILELMAQGYYNKNIAEEMGLSINAVKSILSRLYEKFKVHNRTGAMMAAHRAGYINLRVITKDNRGV